LNNYKKRIPNYSTYALLQNIDFLFEISNTNEYNHSIGIINKSEYLIERARIAQNLLQIVENLPLDFFAYASNFTSLENLNVENALKENISSDFEYDVYLAYSQKDLIQVGALSLELENSGLRVYYHDNAWKKIKPGDSFMQTLNNALEKSKHFVLYCTPNYIHGKFSRLEYETFFLEYSMQDPENRKFIIYQGTDFSKDLVPALLRRSTYCTNANEIIDLLSTPNVQ
jgi:hypothetical protein